MHWPCYCTVHVHVVIHFYDSVWSFWWGNLCRFIIVCLYLYCSWRSNYQEGRVGISLTVSSSVVPAGFKFLFIKKGGLGILSYFCVCPKPGLQHVVMFFFVFNDFRWVVIVHFVYIDGIIYNCLKFLFNFPIGFYSNPHPLWTPQDMTLTPFTTKLKTLGPTRNIYL